MGMTMNTSFANRDMMDLTFVDYSTKKPFMYFDLANGTGYDLTGDSVFAFGGHNHPRRVQFTGNRNGSLRIDTQMQTMRLYQLITGADIVKEASFLRREVLTLPTTGNRTVALKDTPVAGSVSVYAEDDDCGTPMTATASGKNVTVTVATGATAPASVVVYYLTKMENVNNLKITANSFPKAMTIYGTTFMKTEDDEIIPYKMIAYKATAQSNFTVNFNNDGDPTTISITFDLLADKDDNILDLLLDEAEEAAATTPAGGGD